MELNSNTVHSEVKTMKKKLFRILVFMALISLTVIRPTEATITWRKWANPARTSYLDNYYETSVIAYDRGTTAILLVTVENNHNDSAYFRVRVKIDWADDNVTSTEHKISKGKSHNFEIEIVIPDTASNRYIHTYTIYSEYRFAPGDPWTHDDDERHINLVVYSPEQSEANSLKEKLDAYPPYYYYSQIPLLSSSKFRELMINASLHKSNGAKSYARGDFAGARDHYKLALNYTIEAYASDTEYLSSLEVALVGIINAGESYLSFQGWAFFVASLGFLLMGIGVIVYLVRRSKPQAS